MHGGSLRIRQLRTTLTAAGIATRRCTASTPGMGVGRMGVSNRNGGEFYALTRRA
jgi:hypothetical protein